MNKMDKTKKSKNKYFWLGLFVILTIGVMIVFARTTLYITEPFDIGFGIFIDIGAGVVFVSLILLGIIISYFAFRTQRRDKNE